MQTFSTSCLALSLVFATTVYAQEFKLLDRTVQAHGFASQAFLVSSGNNWLSTNSRHGSFAISDIGVNVSIPINSKFHAGAQVYDGDLGLLGKWHPELDWAFGDYRFANWLGVRGGKVKTVLGLYNDTQDFNFIHTWAILPQSIYPLDLRASTIAHTGGDLYGRTRLPKHLGTLAYTVYAGTRSQDLHGGYVLGLAAIGLDYKHYGGWVHGQDLRWETPIPGLVIGASLMNQHTTGDGPLNPASAVNDFLSHMPGPPPPAGLWEREHSIKNDFLQFYGQYNRGRFGLESEYRREYRYLGTERYFAGSPMAVGKINIEQDHRSGYGALTWQTTKRLQLGTYFSWFFGDWATDLSLPTNHVYDGDLTARFEVNPHWDLKLEGHFIDGTGRFDSVRGFYDQVNLGGLSPRTNAVLLKAGYNF